MARVTKRIKNTLIYWLVVYLILFVRLVSRHTALWFFGNLGIVAFHLIRSERKKTIRHLNMAFGSEKNQDEIQQIARQVFINLGRNGADALRLPLMNQSNIDQLIRFEGIEILDHTYKNGKGTFLITGHIGCWELMGAAVALKGYPLYVIGKPVYDPRLDKIIIRNRELSGTKNIARGNSLIQILKALRSNAMIGILIDQDTNVEGVFVDFFGKPAYTPVGPIALALKTGSFVVPMAVQLMDDFKHRVLIKEPIKLTRTGDKKQDLIINTQKLSDFLEETIRLYPSQWVWMHERWRTRPEDKLKKVSQS